MLFTIFHLLSLLVLGQPQDLLKQNLYVGQSVKLKCGVLERYVNIPMKFRWEKPIGNIIGTESTLNLQNVDFKDGGTYTCRASYSFNDKVVEKVLSTQLLINRRDSDSESGGPTVPIEQPNIRFSDPDKDEMELAETEFLYSTCSVRNWINTDYVATWMRYQKMVNGGNSNLFVFPLDTQRDSGTYTCQIYHKNFPEQKYERELRVQIKKPEFIIETLPGEDLRIGGRISRKCLIRNGKKSDYEQMTYFWMKDNSVNVSNSEILNIPITDESIGGQYSCFVSTTKGEKQYREPVQIKISSNGFRVPGGFKLSIFTQPMSPELNKPFQLSCQMFPTIANAQFQWMKNGQVVSNQQVLTLPRFQKSDIGSYSCSVNNVRDPTASPGTFPSTSAKIEFMYSTENKIELFERGSQMISRVGEKRELHCEIPINSNTAGEGVKWYFNGREVDEGARSQYNAHRLDGAMVSILSLLRITSQNEGQYMCDVAGLRKSANLIIMEEQTMMEINPGKLTKDEGEPVEFHCRVNNVPGFSNTQVSWFFKSRDGRRNVPLNANPRWVIMNNPNTPETSFLTTRRCELDDDGFYSCTTPLGEVRTAELTVRRSIGNILLRLSQEVLRVRANEPISIECSSFSSDTGQPIGEPRFIFQSGRNLDQDPRFVEIDQGQSRRRFSVPRGLSESDSVVKVDCRYGGQTKTVTIYVESECPQNNRRCTNGKCVSSEKFCDGMADCSDGSDESSSTCGNIVLSLSPDSVRVRANEPITIECSSVSAVTRQPMGDPKFSFQSGGSLDQDRRMIELNSGQSRKRLLIPGGLSVADSGMRIDCRSGNQRKTITISIEGECPQNYRRCSDGSCQPSAKFCDGVRNCNDGSDEDAALCNNILLIVTQETLRVKVNEPITVECYSVLSNTGQPIGDPKFSFQFGRSLDQDPRFIETTVRESRKRLSIPGGLSVSDNGVILDCRSGSQRKTVTIQVEGECSQDFRRCIDGTCIQSGKFCDRVRDCPDGSDEASNICGNIRLTITPEILRIRVSQPIVIECFSVGRDTEEPIGEPRFTLEYNRGIYQDPRLEESSVGPSRKRLSIAGGLRMTDSGMKVECRVGDQVRTAVVYLETECPQNYRRCNNGDCLPSGKFCDGVRDCPDGSDEVQSTCNLCDPVSTKCEYTGGRMPIKKTFLVHWRCDGENDCGNDYDESLCTDEDKRCSGINFTCVDGKTIPRAYQCDNEPDCSNNEDESGCVLPQIIKSREDQIKRVRKGDSLKLVCEGTSTPKPHILWRHNWGCLKDTSRMKVSNSLRGCNTMVSVLTIQNFMVGDDGIYNCEALSAQNRAFSDDYQVILESV